MESEQIEIPESQEDDNRLTKPVGTIEAERLVPKNVTCKKVWIKQQKKKDTQVIVGDMAVLECKHPDKTELINISKVKYLKNEAVKESGLWYNEDDDKNIVKGSALAHLLAYNKVKSLKELEGKELETTANAEGYLCFKAY